MPGLPDAHAEPILGSDMGQVFKGDAVAKKPAVKAQPAKPEPKASSTQPNAISIRGSAEWKDWLERFAAKMRTGPTAVIDLALAKLAEQERFPEPPPRI